MRDEPITDNDIHRARAGGRSVGSQRAGHAGRCPYPFQDLRLRQAWLEGFSEGRGQLRRRTEGDFGLDHMPRRVTYPLDLQCPQCGTVGTALASETVTPRLGNIEFRLETLSPRFRNTRQGRSLGDTLIVCDGCGTSAR